MIRFVKDKKIRRSPWPVAPVCSVLERGERKHTRARVLAGGSQRRKYRGAYRYGTVPRVRYCTVN